MFSLDNHSLQSLIVLMEKLLLAIWSYNVDIERYFISLRTKEGLELQENLVKSLIVQKEAINQCMIWSISKLNIILKRES